MDAPVSAAREPDRYIHSDIFDRLMEDEEDLTGLVAYSLYQRKKRRWITRFVADKSRPPSVNEVKEYCTIYQTPELKELRRDAESIIFKVGQGLIDERFEELKESAFNARCVTELERLKASIDIVSGYKHHIVGHVLGFFCLVVLYVSLTWAVAHEPSIVRSFTG